VVWRFGLIRLCIQHNDTTKAFHLLKLCVPTDDGSPWLFSGGKEKDIEKIELLLAPMYESTKFVPHRAPPSHSSPGQPEAVS
jgi:hypothetical protein